MNEQDSLQVLTQLGFRDLQHERTIKSSVTTAWGVDWDEEFVARDLMQNFFDANQGRVHEIKIETAGGDIKVSAPAVYNLERLYYLGSEKGNDDVGQYGEGFKVAATCVLRVHGTILVVASDDQVLRIRIDHNPVEATNLYPLVYDYVTTKQSQPGNMLLIRGASVKLASAMQRGLTHFVYPDNPLFGRELINTTDFVLRRSTTAEGHIFYRKLKRGVVPKIPLVLILNKPYAAIEKKISTDRDRKAFGEEIRKAFYALWAKHFFRGYVARQRIVIEAARPSWENGEGHPLLAEIAKETWYQSWDEKSTAQVFGDDYYARSSSNDLAEQLRYESLENEWQRHGRKALPTYFSSFGLPSAHKVIRDLDDKARSEALKTGKRDLSLVESQAIRVLGEVVRAFAPEIMAKFDKGRTTYSVAKTEAILGELKKAYRYHEVFLAESVFETDFAEALSIFLHEHAHIFGNDGSRGFTDALTELLETVIRLRTHLDDYEAKWNEARQQVLCERQQQSGHKQIDYHERLNSMTKAELQSLIQGLPPAFLENVLRAQGERN